MSFAEPAAGAYYIEIFFRDDPSAPRHTPHALEPSAAGYPTPAARSIIADPLAPFGASGVTGYEASTMAGGSAVTVSVVPGAVHAPSSWLHVPDMYVSQPPGTSLPLPLMCCVERCAS